MSVLGICSSLLLLPCVLCSEDGRYIVGVTGALKVYLQIEDPSASLAGVRTPEEVERNRNDLPFSRRSSPRFSSSIETNRTKNRKASREGEHDRSTTHSENNTTDLSPKVREVDVAEAIVRAGKKSLAEEQQQQVVAVVDHSQEGRCRYTSYELSMTYIP